MLPIVGVHLEKKIECRKKYPGLKDYGKLKIRMTNHGICNDTHSVLLICRKIKECRLFDSPYHRKSFLPTSQEKDEGEEGSWGWKSSAHTAL